MSENSESQKSILAEACLALVEARSTNQRKVVLEHGGKPATIYTYLKSYKYRFDLGEVAVDVRW